MAKSGHAFLMKDDETNHGCAACHGPGNLHVLSGGRKETIVNPERQRAKDVDATCNACHLEGKSVEKWTCSEHSKQGVSCIVCHDANAPVGRTLRKPEYQLCGSCHLDVQAQFRLPNRHRVAEGRVSCSDCHDPHGNTDKIRDKDVRYRACLACHQEKGGPFLFDHGIKRGEGCVACHDPHGSTNRRMLTYPRTQPLCLQCHPETPHDLRNESKRYSNCIGCHTEIHGSDLDRRFLK
jgi:DmsE family decaheme c-type cytochrome